MGRAVVSRLPSLGRDVIEMVRDVQAASRRLLSGIALRVADYEDADVADIVSGAPTPPCGGRGGLTPSVEARLL